MSDPVGVIRQSFETRLAAMPGVLPTVSENTRYVPAIGTPYQRANLIVAQTLNDTLVKGLYWERGLFQVALVYPQGRGTAAAEAMAGLLVEWFPRGWGETVGDIRLMVAADPEIHDGFAEDGWWHTIFRARYFASVQQ